MKNEEFIVEDLYDHDKKFALPLGDVEFEPPVRTGVLMRPDRLRVSTTLLTDRKTGEIYLDPMKRNLKPYWLTTEPPTVVANAGVPAPPGSQVVGPVVMPLDRKGSLEIDYSYFQSDGDFTVLMFDPKNRPILMNREIHIRTFASGFGTGGLAGEAGRPFIWPEPWFFAPNAGGRNFMVGFRDLSGQVNNIRFLLHGRRFYYQSSPESVVKRYENYYKGRPVTSPFFYTTEQMGDVTGAAGTVRDFDIRITDEADAIFWKMMAVSQFPFEFQLIEKSINRPMMTDFVRVENGFGNGEFPFILFEPTYFEAGMKLILRIRKLTNDDDTIWPTFACTKIFRNARKKPLGTR